MPLFVPVVIVLGILIVFCLRWFPEGGKRKRKSYAAQNAELIQVLLNLEDEPREQLFKLYGQHFGTGAARYARDTFTKWKNGAVKPNKETFRRFLLHLPEVMSFDLKYCVVGDSSFFVDSNLKIGQLCSVFRQVSQNDLPR